MNCIYFRLARLELVPLLSSFSYTEKNCPLRARVFPLMQEFLVSSHERRRVLLQEGGSLLEKESVIKIKMTFFTYKKSYCKTNGSQTRGLILIFQNGFIKLYFFRSALQDLSNMSSRALSQI